ncbi:MAG: response regulator [Verrucomicrobiota bacterium]
MPTPSNQASTDFNLPEACHALVLLIDDQAFVADAVRRALAEQSDIDFHYCASACEAIAVANELKPTVILLDLVMPHLGGLALLKLLRENTPTSEVPIVVLSAEEEARTKSEAFALGANDYLVKLPDMIELRARVRYHSKAHLNRVQRQEAFKALRESQQLLVKKNTELSLANQELEKAVTEVKQLRGLLPICSYCKKVRQDGTYWQQIESYLAEHSDLTFSHGLCPECYNEVEKDWNANP